MENKKNACIEIIRYKIPLSEHENFENAYSAGARFLQSSPCCTGYNIMKGIDEPDNYIVTIYWTSVEDHMQVFRNSEEFKGFFEYVRPFFNAIQEMKHYGQPLLKWIKLNND